MAYELHAIYIHFNLFIIEINNYSDCPALHNFTFKFGVVGINNKRYFYFIIYIHECLTSEENLIIQEGSSSQG